MRHNLLKPLLIVIKNKKKVCLKMLTNQKVFLDKVNLPHGNGKT